MGYIWTTQLSDFSGGRELDGGIEYDSGEVTLGGTDEAWSTYTQWDVIQNDTGANTLTLSYTPPVDSWMYVELQILTSSNTSDSRALFAIFEDSTEKSYGWTHYYESSNTNFRTTCCHARLDLAAGTAYTITGKIYLPDDGQTITIYTETDETKLIYRLVSKY